MTARKAGGHVPPVRARRYQSPAELEEREVWLRGHEFDRPPHVPQPEHLYRAPDQFSPERAPGLHRILGFVGSIAIGCASGFCGGLAFAWFLRLLP